MHHVFNLRLCLDNLKLTERNGMERKGTEWNGTKISFHCLDILRRNETNFPLHCLESGRNGTNYNFFISILLFIQNHRFVELSIQYMIILA